MKLDREQREAWLRAARTQGGQACHVTAPSARAIKGIGPNKACGHKGGISRQGSKRG